MGDGVGAGEGEAMKDDYTIERNNNRDRLIQLTITTHVPSKWRMVDLETGDIWKHDGERIWTRATDIEIKVTPS